MHTFSFIQNLKPKLVGISPLLITFALIIAQAIPAEAQGGFGASGQHLDFDDHTGFVQIFDGQTMDGWDGASEIWSIEDGAFVAKSTSENPAGTTFMIYKASEVSDFDLKLEVKIEGGGNGGIQYRSRNQKPSSGGGPGGGPGGPPPGAQGQGQNNNARGGQGGPPGGGGGPIGGQYNAWNLQGYQADFNPDGSFAGQLFEGGRFEGERGITTSPGQIVILNEGQPDRLVETIATPEEVQANWNEGEWNEYEIIARDYTFLHIVNGKLISVTIDANKSKRVDSGVIGLQIEGREATVSYRNIWLKKFE